MHLGRLSPSLTSPQNLVRLAERLGRLERYLGRRGVTLEVGVGLAQARRVPGCPGRHRKSTPEGRTDE